MLSHQHMMVISFLHYKGWAIKNLTFEKLILFWMLYFSILLAKIYSVLLFHLDEVLSAGHLLIFREFSPIGESILPIGVYW